MHSFSGTGVTNVPAFLTKLWQLVEDRSTDEFIAWDTSGNSFHVYEQAQFAKEILPLYFKHNNMASFIRQLNMYGFRKVVHIDAGSIKCETDDVEFHHPYFVRGAENLLENIKRKTSIGSSVSNVKTEPGLKLNQEDVTRVLNDVQLLKGKQDNMNTKMEKMKKENEALWREVTSLRNKHIKQQQIVNKLIQFMIHLVGGNSGMTGASLPKRKMPLMINDSSHVPSKRPRYAKQLSIEELQDPQYVVSPPQDVLKIDGHSHSGPVIQEVVDSSGADTPPVLLTHTYSKPPPKTATVASTPYLAVDKVPTTTSKSSDVLGASLDSTDLNNLLQVVDPLSSQSAQDASSTIALDRYMQENPITDRSGAIVQIPKELKGHVENMQEELDGLKDLLGSTSYSVDPTTLYSLFNMDSTVPISVANLLGEDYASSSSAVASTSATDTDPNVISGNELVQFQPLDFMSHIGDLSDIIDESEDTGAPGAAMPTSTVTVPTATSSASSDNVPLDIPDLLSIDPMSFINTGTPDVSSADGPNSADYALD